MDIIAPAAAPATPPPPPDRLRDALDLRARGDAQGSYRALVGIVHSDPESAAAWYHLGQALHEGKKPLGALMAFARSDQLHPGVCETMANRGWMLHQVGRDYEALELLGEVCQRFPDQALPQSNYSQVASLFGMHDAAIEAAERGADLAPAPIRDMAVAFALLAAGRWAAGLKAYEARFPFKIPEFLSYPYPLWRGERVGRLFVQAEQGLGDTLMMMRYIPEAATRCEALTLYVHRELLRLVAGQYAGLGNITVRPLPSALPDADAFCPMMSLPVALGLSDEEMVAERGYIGGITPAPIDPGLKGLKVGLVWGGNQEHEGEPLRAVPLAELARLGELPRVQLYSLQLGPQAEEIGNLGLYGTIRDLGGYLSDFAETAAVLAGLDLLICRDTAIAHLAGAMGSPCWLLVNNRNPEWRWGQNGPATPWYPSTRIFRRATDETSWDLTIDDVYRALAQAVTGKGGLFP